MVAGIQTVGLKYPLNRETLGLGTTRGVSNELIAPKATVQLESGMLLIVHLFKST
jgi:thiamine pyrophosphokinase